MGSDLSIYVGRYGEGTLLGVNHGSRMGDVVADVLVAAYSASPWHDVTMVHDIAPAGVLLPQPCHRPNRVSAVCAHDISDEADHNPAHRMNILYGSRAIYVLT